VGRRSSDAELASITDLFHPDIVIEEHAERLLQYTPVRQPPFPE
jgi:hypothetical protein